MPTPTQLPAPDPRPTTRPSDPIRPADPTQLPADLHPFVAKNQVEELLGKSSKDTSISGRTVETGVYDGAGGPLVVKTFRGEVKAFFGDSIITVPDPEDPEKILSLWVIPKELAAPEEPPITLSAKK